MTVALYIRLSNADEDTGFGKVESESIANQRQYINRFLEEHKTLSTYHRREFVDDGFSGTNGDRPQLALMMEQVQKGEIEVICVKDFSRFFRDYIEAGNYLECVFPFLGVRFLSINDNYDSDDYKGTTGGMEMVMRNMIYAMYSKDLSLKVKSAKLQLIKEGKYIGSHAPYGYRKNPENIHQLIPDAEAAQVVRLIFDLALEGQNTREISERLNNDDIPTPGQYFRIHHPNAKKHGGMHAAIAWTPTRVHWVIRNQMYTGDLVVQRKVKPRYNDKKMVRQPPVIIENTHQGIVTKQEFQLAQAVVQHGTRNPKRVLKKIPLQSLVRCGHCQYAMMRRMSKKDGCGYFCSHSLDHSKKGCTMCESVAEAELEGYALHAIQHCMVAAKQVRQTKEKALSFDAAAPLKELVETIDRLKQSKLRLYESYTNGTLDRACYLKQKADLEEKLTAKLQQEQELREKASTQAASSGAVTRTAFAEISEIFQNTQQLTYEMAHAFIESIYVYGEKEIEIKMKFEDAF